MKRSVLSKKNLYLLFAAGIGILLLLLSGCGKPDSTAIFFGSDAHLSVKDADSAEMMRKVLRHAYRQGSGLQALVFAGDQLDNGTEEEYGLFLSVLKDQKKKATQMTACMGNHEWYKYGWGVDVLANYGMAAEMQRMFRDQLQCGIESDITVDGIHIISVSPDNELDIYHTREAYAKERIAAAAKEAPENPIFFVAHKNMAHTVISTWYEGDEDAAGYAPDWSEDFKRFLAGYPQLIYISGHTHNSLKDPGSIFQDACTHVNDGCMRDGEYLLAEVSRDRIVTLHRMDAAADQEIGDPWVIDIGKAVRKDADAFPYGASRYEASAELQFPGDARPEIEKVTPGSVTLSFPEATGQDTVGCAYAFSYIITVTDRETGERIDPNGIEDEWPEGQIRLWQDDYYGVFRDRRLTVEGLSPDTAYTAEVYAINALGKPGNTIRTEFTTPAK